MPKRDPKHMQERRQQILDAAIMCFTERGYEAATMKQISEQAGLSIGALYTHFKNKRELIIELLEWANEHRGNIQINSLEELKAFFHAGADELSGEKNPGLHHLNIHILQSCFTDKEIRAALAKSTESSQRLMEHTLTKLKEKGEIRADYDIQASALLLAHIGTSATLHSFISSDITSDSIRSILIQQLNLMKPI
ncbi:TetR/AcrR family transcriptional regulator [Kordiimonas pumila]|uniref:TetR/AcrR family transcriptional regulator n=1 Tax=Kordiimonas pumila TaxID=2161677 RepID=A0ABV7D9C0_9PROT|nr:TetR/AcrR family transcriptional regulator [Kordiimonas pumila]